MMLEYFSYAWLQTRTEKGTNFFFLEGQGFIKGCDLLIKKFHALGGRKESKEVKPSRKAKAHQAEANPRRFSTISASYAEVTRNKDVNQYSVWVDM